VALAIIVAGNFLANRYNKTFDATKNKLYSLSDQTEKILDNLETDLTIYYFDRNSEFGAARNSLERYANASSHVNVQYIDPDSKPEIAKSMNVRTYGTVLVEVGANREEAKTAEEEQITNTIINYSLASPYVRIDLPVGVSYAADPRRVEQILLEAAAREPLVVRFRDPVVRFVGYGESSIDFELLFWIDIRATPRRLVRSNLYFAIFAALRPGGVYVIVDHSAPEGAGTTQAQTNHRIEESVVRDEVQKAGFQLVASANFLRNPSDTRDWNASPHAAGERRGTSDRFVLKFRKP